MEPFIGMVILFGGNFAPRGWALCDGQLLPISENTSLFSILGTTYGGDGRTTFALPDLRGRVPLHPGHGPGLTQRTLGEKVGNETVALSAAEMPSHSHAMNVANVPADNGRPSGDMFGQTQIFTATATPTATLNAATIANNGGNEAHDNMQPSLGINYIIALQGIYPSRS